MRGWAATYKAKEEHRLRNMTPEERRWEAFPIMPLMAPGEIYYPPPGYSLNFLTTIYGTMQSGQDPVPTHPEAYDG